jgi:4a-hydroxytetrahydrobiopterin dehydratase
MSTLQDWVEVDGALERTFELPSFREAVGFVDRVEVDGALERTFELPSFREAVGFVNRVADLAEEEDHHPDISISYKKVTLRWTTHSAGGITDRDRQLAARSGELA